MLPVKSCSLLLANNLKEHTQPIISKDVAQLDQRNSGRLSTNCGDVAMTEAQLATTFDSVMQRRNGTVHFANGQSLELDALLPARSLLARQPTLRTRHLS